METIKVMNRNNARYAKCVKTWNAKTSQANKDNAAMRLVDYAAADALLNGEDSEKVAARKHFSAAFRSYLRHHDNRMCGARFAAYMAAFDSIDNVTMAACCNAAGFNAAAAVRAAYTLIRKAAAADKADKYAAVAAAAADKAADKADKADKRARKAAIKAAAARKAADIAAAA